MTELGHILYWLFLLRSLTRSYNWLITAIWKFLTFKTLPPHFLKNLIILIFQVDPGPCRYYPTFFPVMWRYYTQKIFCPPESGSGSGLRIRIRMRIQGHPDPEPIQIWIRIRIRIHNTSCRIIISGQERRSLNVLHTYDQPNLSV